MPVKSKRPTPTEVADRIVAAASELYAEHGFDVPLARIARTARVTPAALARHFRTRRALLDAVIARLFAGRWKPEWDALLVDRSIPLAQRLSRFYTEYRSSMSRANSRLWTRAGLLGVHASGRFSGRLAERILAPVIRELRHEGGLPDNVRVSKAEIELAQMLHGCIAFPNTRSHIFGMDVHGRQADLIAMMVRVWMPGALDEIHRLHRH